MWAIFSGVKIPGFVVFLGVEMPGILPEILLMDALRWRGSSLRPTSGLMSVASLKRSPPPNHVCWKGLLSQRTFVQKVCIARPRFIYIKIHSQTTCVKKVPTFKESLLKNSPLSNHVCSHTTPPRGNSRRGTSRWAISLFEDKY